MLVTELFPRAYIVNLPERRDRKQEMEHEFARLGLPCHSERIRFFPALRPDDPGDFPSIGARGCYLSHLAILQQALADGVSSVLIMEDDLTLSPLCSQIPQAMSERLQQPWHFAYWGHIAPLPTPSQAQPCWHLQPAPMATTHFYALHGSILPRVVAYLQSCLTRPEGDPQGGPMHVDGAYSLFRQLNPDIITLMACPSLGGQRSSRSDIFPNQWYDRWPLTRSLVQADRKSVV